MPPSTAEVEPGAASPACRGGTLAVSPSGRTDQPYRHPMPGQPSWPSAPRSPKPSSGRTPPSPGCSSPCSRRGHVLLEGVPGRRQDPARPQPRRRARRRDQAHAVHARPDAGRRHRLARLRRANSDFIFRQGPVFTNLLLADEINRTPPKTQSALLEAMEERQVTVDGRDAPAAPAVHGRRHAEPRRARGHLSPAGGPARPLPAQGDAADPAPGRRDRRPARHATGFDPRDLHAAGLRPVASAADLAAGAEAVRTGRDLATRSRPTSSTSPGRPGTRRRSRSASAPRGATA